MFEYLAKRVEGIPSAGESVLNEMNRIGREGWEVIQLRFENSQAKPPSERVTIYAKRKIEKL